jgi:uncharacterized tellurite resistance protein B-like protein
MLDAITRFFRSQIASPPGSTEEDSRRLQIATCALLLEVAHADQEFSPSEQHLIRSMVRQRFQLTTEQAEQLMDLADQQRQQSTDLYQFARLINEQLTRPQKLSVLQQFWRIVYSDGRLEAHEDALLHKLCNLLDLSHRELIALKLRAKQDSQQGPA